MTANLPDLDEIFKNLLTNFDPSAKRLVQAGRELSRAWIAVAEATKVYAEAVERLGTAGYNCGGETREIGQCLLQVAEALKELNKHEKSTISFYESQVLVPTDANLDQDSKVLIEERRSFEKKLKEMTNRLRKDRKKGVPTEETERMLHDFKADCVKQALTEEKKRYTYVLDRHCALANWQLQFFRTATSLYEEKIHKWKEACANPEELSAAALAALDAAIQPYATQSSMSLSTVSRGAIRTVSNSETDTISNSVPATPTVREQGVGTFHVNEGENVKATLDAATILLQNQQKPHQHQNGQSHQPPTRNIDPPSTGSSTLSNGSRYASPVVEPIVQKTTQIVAVQSMVVKNGNGENCEYAVAVKPRQKTASPGVISRNGNGTAASPISKRRSVAMFTYANGGANQLAFREGDVIVVIQDGQQGWRFGENVATGKRGWYPASFTKGDSNGHGDERPQPRPRSQSNSTMNTVGSVNSGYNGYNGTGNGIKHSPPSTNGDYGINGKTTKPSPRPVSMMIQNNPTTPPTHRPAPPPPAPPPPPDVLMSDEDSPVVYLDEKQSQHLHMINYDTVPKHNPFAHVRLRHVVKTDGTPKKYG